MIRVGTLCYLSSYKTVPSKFVGRIVEVVEPLQPMRTYSRPEGCHAYMVYATWLVQPVAAVREELIPINDPDDGKVEKWSEPKAPVVQLKVTS